MTSALPPARLEVVLDVEAARARLAELNKEAAQAAKSAGTSGAKEPESKAVRPGPEAAETSGNAMGRLPDLWNLWSKSRRTPFGSALEEARKVESMFSSSAKAATGEVAAGAATAARGAAAAGGAAGAEALLAGLGPVGIAALVAILLPKILEAIPAMVQSVLDKAKMASLATAALVELLPNWELLGGVDEDLKKVLDTVFALETYIDSIKPTVARFMAIETASLQAGGDPLRDGFGSVKDLAANLFKLTQVRMQLERTIEHSMDRGTAATLAKALKGALLR